MQDVFASPGAIAFELGPLQIRWYGILMATSIVVGFWLAHRRRSQEGLPADDIMSVAQWAILAGLIGARLYEVAFNWDYYGRVSAEDPRGVGRRPRHPRRPHRGAAGRGAARAAVACADPARARRHRAQLAIGQAIGRWGNFFNEEAFGQPTDLPWKLYISPPHRPPGYAQFDYFHPTFLYESLWNLAVFALLVSWLRPRLREQPGALFFAYIGLYSIGRFLIEASGWTASGCGPSGSRSWRASSACRGDRRPGVDPAAGHHVCRG